MGELQIVDSKAIIVQSSELVEANYKLSIAEQRLILALASQIDTKKEDFEIVKVTAKSLSEVCNFTSKNNYAQLQQTVKKILNRSIIIKRRNSNDWYGTHWVQSCEYRSVKNNDVDCSYVEVEFDKRLCPHLLQLSNRFLRTDLNRLVSFKHTYSTRFYMIFRNLVNNLPKCTKKYSFKEIIKLLGLPKTYEQYTINIKNKVIKIAVEEINKTTDIFVKYEYYTEGGRAHVGVIFTFWKKNTETNEINQPKLVEPPEVSSSTLSSTNDDQDHSASVAFLNSLGIHKPTSATKSIKENESSASAIDEIVADTAIHNDAMATQPSNMAGEKFTAELSEEQKANYDMLIKQGVTAKTSRDLAKEFPTDRICRNIKYTEAQSKFTNKAGFLVHCIRNDTAYQTEEELQRLRQQELDRKRKEWERAEKERMEHEEKLKIEREKLKEMKQIREQYSEKFLNKILKEVSEECNNDYKKISDEQKNKLAKYGLNYHTHLVIFMKFHRAYKHDE